MIFKKDLHHQGYSVFGHAQLTLSIHGSLRLKVQIISRQFFTHNFKLYVIIAIIQSFLVTKHNQNNMSKSRYRISVADEL